MNDAHTDATTEGSSLAGRLAHVGAGIAEAVHAAGRAETDVTLIVVTKFQPVELIRELYGLGIRDVGENRHQEARTKSAELAELDLTWHFVGQLQSKKARQAAAYARVIHSIDRDSVVDALATDEKDLATEVFVQVNLTDDPDRGGVQPKDVERMAQRVLDTAGLSLLGVMAVAPVGEDARAAFARLRVASESVVALSPVSRFISAGMSGDYREAILEGATHLRIGAAITANRPDAG